MDDLISDYIVERIGPEFARNVSHLFLRGYTPAGCLVGLFQIYGVGGFSHNLTTALNYLKPGLDAGLWSCWEAYGLHPNCENRSLAVRRAAELGGIWSQVRLARGMAENFTERYEIYRDLATLQAITYQRRGDWWTPEYAQALEHISEGVGEDADWDVMESLALEDHWPAALWVADRLAEKGEFVEAAERLRNAVFTGPWQLDLAAMMRATNEFDRVPLLQLAVEMGSLDARVLMSWAWLFENSTHW